MISEIEADFSVKAVLIVVYNFMKTKHVKTCRIYLLCLAGFVFAFNNALGFVYCQAEDGHSSLEPIVNTCCNVANISTFSENAADSVDTTFFVSSDNCGPCVDKVVSVDVVNSDKKTAPLDSALAAVPAVLTMTAGCDGASAHVLSSELPVSVNPSLPSIRTVILLA